LFVVVSVDFKAYITTDGVHLYLLHALFLQKIVYCQGTVRTGHPFYFPIHFLHSGLFILQKHGKFSPFPTLSMQGYWVRELKSLLYLTMKLIFSLSEIEFAARQFWNTAPDTKVFAFHGDMGAGKTTFIAALCKVKGVSTGISSPTFSIINEYRAGQLKIFHLDL
jgi:hypothetical protein